MRKTLLCAKCLVLATLPLLVATPHSEAANDSPAVVVTMNDDNEFVPVTVEVHVGDTVLWKNTASMSHTVTADPKRAKDPKHVVLPEGASTFDSGKLKAGMTFKYTFSIPGRYTYVCVPHEKEGMIGHVVVKK